MKNVILGLIVITSSFVASKSNASQVGADVWQCRASCTLAKRAYEGKILNASVAVSSTAETPLEALDKIKSQCKKWTSDEIGGGYYFANALNIGLETKFDRFTNRYFYTTVLATPANACAKL